MVKSSACVCFSNEKAAVLNCADCGLPISSDALVCPYCAKPLNAQNYDFEPFNSECEKEWKLAFLSLDELGLLHQLMRYRHPEF